MESISISTLFECTFERWQPKIGDPNIMGWVTVGVYLVTFLFAMLVANKTDPTRRTMRLFWILLTWLMLFLAINKQLDLQSFLTATARCVAKMQGWYEERRSFQFKVVLAMGAIAVVIGVFFLWQLRRDLKRNWLALMGMVLVFGFVLVRAVGWHDFDAVINTRVANIRMNWVLELSGLILSPIHRPRRRKRRAPVYRRDPEGSRRAE